MTSLTDRRAPSFADSRHLPALVALAAFAALAWFSFFPPDEAYARGHDFLDHVFVYYVLRARLEGFFLNFDAVVPQLAGGLPYNALGFSDFQLGPNIYLLLEPFSAYVANELLRRLLALAGAYLLLQRYLLPDRASARWIAAFAALAFALLPDQPNRFGTLSLQPLLFWALLNVWQGERPGASWAAILFYPFYSLLYLGGFVICGYLLLVALAARRLRHPRTRQFAAAFVYLCAAYLLMEARMFHQWFVIDNESYRRLVEHAGPDLGAFFRQFASEFILGNNANHVTGHSPVALAIVLAAAALLALPRLRSAGAPGREDAAEERRVGVWFVLLLALVFLNAVVNALDQAGFLDFKYALGFPFSFHRMDVTSPLAWRLLLALSIVIFAFRLAPRWRAAAYLALASATAYSMLQFPGVKEEIVRRLGAPPHVGLKAALTGNYGPPRPYLHVKGSYHPGYTRLSDYYATEAFGRIRRDLDAALGEPSGYRTISLGITPSVSQFHGFYTLDGLFYDVSADYARSFVQLAAPEYAKQGLEPNERTGGLVLHVAPQSLRDGVVDLAFDACRFRAMGGRVLFSAWPIAEAAALGLKEFGAYDGVRVYLTAGPARCPP